MSVACQMPRTIRLNRDRVCQYSITSSGVVGLPVPDADSMLELWFPASPVCAAEPKTLVATSLCGYVAFKPGVELISQVRVDQRFREPYPRILVARLSAGN